MLISDEGFAPCNLTLYEGQVSETILLAMKYRSVFHCFHRPAGVTKCFLKMLKIVCLFYERVFVIIDC